MSASHQRRIAASILSVVVLGALSACGPSTHASASSTSVKCDASAACTTSAVTLDSTTLTVASEASRASQTVMAELVTDQQLHCPSFVPSGDALAIFSSTAADAPKTVTYTVTGAAAEALSAAHRGHPQFLGCFGSPQPFTGYAGPKSSKAVFIEGDGLYEAGLFPCAGRDTKPCFAYAESGDTVTLTIQAAAGDPKMIG